MNNKHKVDDKIVKFISVPLIAIVFSNISGLIVTSRYSAAMLLAQYCYFIFLVYLLWQGNIQLIILIKSKVNLENAGFTKYIFAIIISNIVYAIILIGSMLLIWTVLLKQNHTSVHTLIKATLVLSCIATFITLIYENYILNRKKINALSKIERMSLVKIQAELAVLKSQIDPHFIFNALNTLSYLISSSPINAKLYNETLAKVYQYILVNKEKDLVLLREEIEFIGNYFYLLKIRFRDAIRMKIDINDCKAEQLLIPPISLQILIENAVKHNQFSQACPLEISVSVLADYVIVSNFINNKSFTEPSPNTGLKNLDSRCRLITQRNIVIDINKFFTVKLPLINLI